MSLFFLANTGRGGDQNNDNNNQYITQFRDEINIPAHAKVSVEKAFIPVSGLIVIDGVNRQNNQFVIRFEAPPSTSANLYLRMLCTLADGVYNAEDFANVIEEAINNQLVAYPNPFGTGTGGSFPTQNPWGSAGAGEVPAQFNEPALWTCSVQYNASPASGTSNYLISFLNTRAVGGTNGLRKIRPYLNVSPSDLGVPINQGGLGINSLAYILQVNYLFDSQGKPINNFGITFDDYTYISTSLVPAGATGLNLYTGTNVQYNGQDTGGGTAFTNALIIEIPELGTQLYNSFLRTKVPAVAVVPISALDQAQGFVVYTPRFPLELMCANETQMLINSLSVYIKNADGSPALCSNKTERTYIVLRIETEQDVEKELTSQVKREQRKELIKKSLLFIAGGIKEFVNPKELPQPKEPSVSSSYAPPV